MKSFRMFHGKPRPISQFSYQFITKEGNNQEGPGFYLTSDIADAKKYGNNIYIVNASYRKLVPVQGTKNLKEALAMVKMAPDVSEELLNWGDNATQGLANYLKGLASYTKPNNPQDMFLQIWTDFYRDSRLTAYLKNMVKIGYDGMLIKTPYGHKNPFYHFIAFDPDKLKIVGMI